MKTRFAVSTLAALMIAAPGVFAQGNAAHPAADPPMKVGVINMQSAIASTAEGKQDLAQLQAQFAPRTAEISTLEKRLQDLQAKAQAEANTASDDEKANLQLQYSNLSRTYQRKNQDLNDDENEAQQEMVSTIGRKMMNVLSKYAAQNGYAVIIDTDTSAQQMPVVLFRADQIDVSQEIVRLYDQTYPVKAAAATSKPSNPKPAPKPQR